VTAWTTDIGGQKDVMFQRYDAAGNAQGGPTMANSTTNNNQVLSDITATDDGHFVLAWTTGNKVTARSFDSFTGSASGAEITVNASGAGTIGAQGIATSSTQ